MYKKLLAALFVAVAMGASSQKADALIQTVSVGPNGSLTFSPASFSINLGDTVKWVWVSGSHTTTSTTIPAGAATWNTPMVSAASTLTYVPTVAGTYNYQCTPHAASGMNGTFTVVTCTAPTTPVITAPNGSSACQGSSVNLTIPIQPSASYQWYLNGTPLSTATSNSINTGNAGNYTVTVTNNCGASSSTAFTVTINPIPASTFTSALGTGKTYSFNPTVLTGVTYAWNFGETGSATNLSTLATPSHTYATSGNFIVTLKVTSSTSGCNSTTTTTITVPTSVATIGREVFTISPNPASSQLVVHTTATDAALSLLDNTGRLVAKLTPSSRSSNNLYFDVSQIPSGLYLLQIKTTAGTAFDKVQIMH